MHSCASKPNQATTRPLHFLDPSFESIAMPVEVTPNCVRQFRQTLLWPLRLMPVRGSEGRHAKPWELLANMGAACPWQEVVDEYTGGSGRFKERHYNEFVSFLPFVQRFLYGEGRPKGTEATAGSPMRVFRRSDVSAMRAVPYPGAPPITLNIAHVDLYFFLDLDLVLLNVEVSAKDLTLAQAQDLLHRFGRGYPASWDADGNAQHCLHSAEWLSLDNQVLASSDASQRDTFMAHVSSHRAPRVAAHWAWLLQPLVGDHSGEAGNLRYRQIEYYRMPQLAYMALDDPLALSRNDLIRFGLATGPAALGAPNSLPYAEGHLADFEKRFCDDRFWTASGAAPHTRYMCTGHNLLVFGRADSAFFVSAERGVLAQFRHQHFLLFLIAHFQKAALLMFSDRLAEALKNLDISDAASVRRFKRTIRDSFAGFLRFTHRYWFHEVSEQPQVRALFRMCANHLELDALYKEVRERIAEMNLYLDADSLRRQANTVVRLTVVTIFGLIGTVSTGFLGMNLLAEAEAPASRKLLIFAVVFTLAVALTLYTMVKSKRLSDFLDVLSDERASAGQKLKSFGRVWGHLEDREAQEKHQ